MKKMIIALLALSAVLIAVNCAQAFEFSCDAEGTHPGAIGTQVDVNTITWNISNVPATLGGYFYIDFTPGTGGAVTLNFYTSFNATGDAWAVFAPKDGFTSQPTLWNLTMPAAAMVWVEPIPFPDGTQRVKVVHASTDAEETHEIVIRLIPGTK